jgi:glutamate racemase
LWVPLIENNEYGKPGADYFVKEYMDLLWRQNADIDAVLLACTHYPLLKDKIAGCLPAGTRLIVQGEIVANSLADYLQRHPEIEARCSRYGERLFYTTDSTEDFDTHASIFYGGGLRSSHVQLN